MIDSRMRRGAFVAAFLAMALVAACHADAPSTPISCTTAPTVAVTFQGGALTAELAVDSAQRANGLQHRATLCADHGMLFAYPYTQQPEFEKYWMLDTPLPLSIAFLDSTKTVINLDDMQPNTTTLHSANARFLYAIEANLGWFAAHGVVAGSMASFSLPAGATPTR